MLRKTADRGSFLRRVGVAPLKVLVLISILFAFTFLFWILF